MTITSSMGAMVTENYRGVQPKMGPWAIKSECDKMDLHPNRSRFLEETDLFPYFLASIYREPANSDKIGVRSKSEHIGLKNEIRHAGICGCKKSKGRIK